MKWKGEYRVKCPKCKGRDILVEEHCDAYAQHHIVNGEWLHHCDANDFGDYTFTVYVCKACHHTWQFRGTMDRYLKSN